MAPFKQFRWNRPRGAGEGGNQGNYLPSLPAC
jgi:hypothetical protein